MNWKDKKVLVTGGAGFIGSHLTEKLIELGAEVTIADNRPTTENIAHLIDRINLQRIDISSNSDIDNVYKDVDFVYHLAACAVPSLCEKNPDIAFKTNVQGTFNVLKFALENGVKKLIFPSSALLYTKYPKYLPIDEKHPIELNTVYNTTKKIGEDLCNMFYERHGLPVVFFRLFNSFGPKQAVDYLIPTVIMQAIKTRKVEVWSEKPVRDFVFIEDTIDAFIKAVEADYCGGPINIGSGKEVRIGDIVKKIADSFNAEMVFLNKDVIGPMRLQCDNTHAKNVLKWEQKIEFDEGLNRTIDWFKNEGPRIYL